MFWGLISPVYYLRVGAPDVEPQIPHSSERRSVSLWSFWLWNTTSGVWSFFLDMIIPLYLCFSYPSQCCPFTLCCGNSVHSIFRPFPEGIIPYVVVDLLCLWEEVTSGTSYAAICSSLVDLFLWTFCSHVTHIYLCYFLLLSYTSFIILGSSYFPDTCTENIFPSLPFIFFLWKAGFNFIKSNLSIFFFYSY